MNKLSAAKLFSNKRVLKYGAAFTVGAGLGASYGATAFGVPGERENSGRQAAIQGITIGAVATAAVLGRKHITKFVKGGLNAVGFRRIRGRIVPIFKKAAEAAIK